jgi:hypothetical protein
MTIVSQKSFASGEIAPSLHARTDFYKYATGLATCRNMLVMRHGGATNRPGTTFISEVKHSDKNTRLIEFVFNVSQTYVLEFGDKYMRVIKDESHIKVSPKNITAATKAAKCEITATVHNFSNGDEVFISGIEGMVELNNRNFIVSNKTTDTFELKNLDGTDVDSTNYGTFSGVGLVEKVYEIETVYSHEEIFDIRFVQSADVITMVHPNHPPTELSRKGDDDWSFNLISFTPDINFPMNVNVSSFPSGGSKTFNYKVTAISEENFEESVPGKVFTGKEITGITQANPAVVTSSSHGFSNGDEVYIDGIVGMEELNGRKFTVASSTTNTFELSGEDSSAYGAYDSGGDISPSITGVTMASPAVVTMPGHGFNDGDEVYIENVEGMNELNNRSFIVANKTTNTFELEGIDSTVYTSYTSGGSVYKTHVTVSSVGTVDVSNPIVIEWSKVLGAREYNVYKESNGVYGLVGIAQGNSFEDVGVDEDTSESPPRVRNPFVGTGSYPSTVTYIQQRLAFAGTINDPEKIYMSKTANFKNFTTSSPIQDDDAVTFSMVGRQVNEVEHMVDLGRLVILTSGGEWAAEGDSAGIIRPTDINTKQYSYNGSGRLQPIVVGGAALYQQARGSIIRDLGYDYQVDGYRGNDMTIFSSHLFDKFTLVDWAYQQIPHSITWVVRSDGTLLGLTFIREHELVAWHRHDFEGGKVKSVAAVPKGNEDKVYMIVEREINGSKRQYIEAMQTRKITDLNNAIFMDSTLSYDGRNTDTSHTMTLSGGNTWAYDEEIDLTSSEAYFSSAEVGNRIDLRDSEGNVLRCKIDSYVNTTVVKVKPHKTVPSSLRSTATSNWARSVDELVGLWHLEGKEVSVFADRFVVASPNNESYDKITVSNGKITLDKPYSVVHVGLPFTSDLETLDLDNPQGETLDDKQKNIQNVTIHVEESRGIWVGTLRPKGASYLEGLDEMKVRIDEGYDDPIALKTGKIDINIRSQWDSTGRIFIRQVDPIPMTILSASPAGYIPMR